MGAFLMLFKAGTYPPRASQEPSWVNRPYLLWLDAGKFYIVNILAWKMDLVVL